MIPKMRWVGGTCDTYVGHRQSPGNCQVVEGRNWPNQIKSELNQNWHKQNQRIKFTMIIPVRALQLHLYILYILYILYTLYILYILYTLYILYILYIM